MTNVIVIGAGGHAAEVCSYILRHAEQGGDLRLLGCIDDHKPAGRMGLIDVLGDYHRLAALLASDPAIRCITAVGDNTTRRLLVARAEALAPDRQIWLTLADAPAYVGPDVEIGAGTCLAPGSIVTTRARVGRHCILNVNVSVSHDAVVADYVNLNPRVVVAGSVRIGEGCYIGAGATVIDRVTIGAGAIVGAGAVVVEDLPPNVTAVGVPARVIKYRPVAWEPGVVPRRA
jgi:sugar O-acyltransferase (sialic acid O-acetyltransferase NeuD family)